MQKTSVHNIQLKLLKRKQHAHPLTFDIKLEVYRHLQHLQRHSPQVLLITKERKCSSAGNLQLFCDAKGCLCTIKLEMAQRSSRKKVLYVCFGFFSNAEKEEISGSWQTVWESKDWFLDSKRGMFSPLLWTVPSIFAYIFQITP